MIDHFEPDDEEWVEISDTTGERASMRLLATISFGGKVYHVLAPLKEDADLEDNHGLMLVREDHTVDGAQEYVITEDEHEIESVVGRFVMHTIMKVIEHAMAENNLPDPCSCGMRHRAGDFCYCDEPEYLQ